jgi:predicted ABC-type ATPase
MYYTPNMTLVSETEIDAVTAAHLQKKFLPLTLTSQASPTVYAMAGIPGSGKSEYVRIALERGTFPRDAFILNPDLIMQALPAYQDDLALAGKQTAFRKWEIPARLLTYQFGRLAAERRLNIIQDMGGVRREDYDRLAAFKASGYRIEMTYIHCPVEVCLARLVSRTTRHTAEEMVHERASSLRQLLPAYVKLVDTFTVFDNGNDTHPFRPATLEEVTSA